MFKIILVLEKFWVQKDLSKEKKFQVPRAQKQDEFGPDKCHLNNCIKHLGSTYLCEFRLLAKFQLSRLSRSCRNRWAAGGSFHENNATFWLHLAS